MINPAKWLLAAFHGIRVSGHTSTRTPYTGDELRAIRKRNGVGRPPHVGHSSSRWAAKTYPAYLMSGAGRESPNFYQWVMKPRGVVTHA